MFTSNKKGNGVAFTVFGCGKTKVLLVKQQLVQILTPADFQHDLVDVCTEIVFGVQTSARAKTAPSEF